MGPSSSSSSTMDHFHNFHAKIQVLANLNESIVNSHFPEDLAQVTIKKEQRVGGQSSEITATSDTERSRERGPPTIRPNIPLEIIEHILHDLSKAELLPALQANKSIHSVAVRLLYRELTIASSETSSSRTVAFLRDLVANTSVHIHIRKLDINVSTIVCPTANFYRLLHRLLKSTTCLAVLALDLPKSQSPVWIFDGCSFKLRQLSTSMHCTPDLARFLDTQDSIAHLTLRGFQSDAFRSLPYIYMDITNSLSLKSPQSLETFAEEFSLQETSLPRLKCFNAIHAGPAVVKEVVKGRPVTTVSIPLFSMNALQSLDALKESAVPLKRLSVISFDPDAPTFIFEQIAIRFPELEALHIVVLLAEFTNVSCTQSPLRRLADLFAGTASGCMPTATAVQTTEGG